MARKVNRRNDNILRDGLIVLVILAIGIGIVWGIFAKTKKPIDEASVEAKLISIKEVFGNDASLDVSLEDLSSPVKYDDGTVIYTKALVKDKAGSEVGMGFIVKSKGYSKDTDITLAVGIGNDGAVTGVNVVYMNETSGVGDQCLSEDFLNQFKGRTGRVQYDDIDGISQATDTVNGFVAGVDACLKYYNEEVM